MLLTSLLLTVAARPEPAVQTGPALPSGLLAIRVGRAETISGGTLEHAVILIEDGKIVMVGQDLEIERGIPVLDRPEWVAMPGLVDCWSRIGMDSDAGNEFQPQVQAASELFARQDIWKDVLETGVTTLGLYPGGGQIPGQSVAVRPFGSTPAEMILQAGVNLVIYLRADAGSKKALRQGFANADEYNEKEVKNKEKWEKDQEKKAKDEKKDEKKEEKKEEGSTSTPSDEKKDDKKEEKKNEYVPSEPEPKAKAFVHWRLGALRAVVAVNKAADILHLWQTLGEEPVEYDLRMPLRDDVDFFFVADKIGEKKLRILCEPRITLQPSTRRERNIPAEILAAGGKVAFVPRADNVAGCKDWLKHVGEVVGFGFERQAALRAVTLEPAAVLGLEAQLGSLEAGKTANLVFFDGDPLEPATKLMAVMLEGRIVKEVKQ